MEAETGKNDNAGYKGAGRKMRGETAKRYSRELTARCIEAHKAAFEEWPYGEMQKAWVDEQGNLCIRYTQSE